MDERSKKICKALLSVNRELAKICAVRGYEIARGALITEINNTEYEMRHTPQEITARMGIPSDVVRCMSKYEIEFTEDDVYRVMHGVVRESIRDIEIHGMPTSYWEKVYALNEIACEPASDVVAEKLQELAKRCGWQI